MKTRSIIFTTLAALLLTACRQDGYQIKGTAEGLADGDSIILTTDLENLTPLDTLIVENGHFSYSGSADSVQLALLMSINQGASAMFFTEQGTINITLSSDPFRTHVGGTKANDGWQKITDLSNDYGRHAQSQMELLYSDSLSEEDRQKAFAELQRLESEMQQKLVEQTEQNIDNELGYFILTNLSGDDDTFTPEKRKELIGRMPEKFRNRPAVKAMEEEMDKNEDIAVGKSIADFSLKTPKDEEFRVLTEVAKHKVTILDFWASWCGPCRQEMPFMKDLFAKYKDKGLGVIGISLDEDKEAWTKAIDELGLAWPQISDLKGWQSEAGELFHVNAIPFLVIVDQDGTILAKGLRGEQLSEFISKHLD